MFEGLTELAARTLAEAELKARHCGHREVGTEHILLALCAREDGVVATLLGRLGVRPGKIRAALEKLMPASKQPPGRETPPFSAAARRSIEHARKVTRLLGHNYTSTEHLLLGLFKEPDELAAQVLKQLDLVEEEIRNEIERILGSGPHYSAPSPGREMKVRRDAYLRVFDANFNRATEALRVIEDAVRFVLDQEDLTQRLKDLRHQLVQVIKETGISAAGLLAARDTEGDVGAPSDLKPSVPCRNLSELARANFKRLQEALRVLEEFASSYAPAARPGLEKLRYESYKLEKALAPLHALWKRLEDARLCVILTAKLCSAPLEEAAAAAIAGGADMVQLREKELSDREFQSLAHRLKDIVQDADAIFIVNDRVDTARIVDADGVHVGQEDLPVLSARQVVGAGKIIGISTHSLEQAKQAVAEGADYIGIGPAFVTSTKPGAAVVGVQLAGEVASKVSKPAFAIGGITRDNLDQLLQAGVNRVAICSAIISQKDIEAATREIKEKLPAH